MVLDPPYFKSDGDALPSASAKACLSQPERLHRLLKGTLTWLVSDHRRRNRQLASCEHRSDAPKLSALSPS